MAFIAAFLGWMFDGFEIGLFPLVAQPALKDMLPGAPEKVIGNWIGVMTAAFLVGAATGGVVFGWLGDRIGRVRAMALSILTYALFSGMCGLVTQPWHLFVFRFLASLGMGGEWSLGVSLVMEIWPNKSRGWLAGLIGAAANVGFVLIAVLSLVLTRYLAAAPVSAEPTDYVSQLFTTQWRLLAMSGALPALLTFIVRIFVPESEKWLHEHKSGSTKQWSTNDLLAVLLGAASATALVSLWALDDVLARPAPQPQQQQPGRKRPATNPSRCPCGFASPAPCSDSSARTTVTPIPCGVTCSARWPPRTRLRRPNPQSQTGRPPASSVAC